MVTENVFFAKKTLTLSRLNYLHDVYEQEHEWRCRRVHAGLLETLAGRVLPDGVRPAAGAQCRGVHRPWHLCCFHDVIIYCFIAKNQKFGILFSMLFTSATYATITAATVATATHSPITVPVLLPLRKAKQCPVYGLRS